MLFSPVKQSTNEHVTGLRASLCAGRDFDYCLTSSFGFLAIKGAMGAAWESPLPTSQSAETAAMVV